LLQAEALDYIGNTLVIPSKYPISNDQVPIAIEHWTFGVGYWIFSFINSGPFGLGAILDKAQQ